MPCFTAQLSFDKICLNRERDSFRRWPSETQLDNGSYLCWIALSPISTFLRRLNWFHPTLTTIVLCRSIFVWDGRPSRTEERSSATTPNSLAEVTQPTRSSLKWVTRIPTSWNIYWIKLNSRSSMKSLWKVCLYTELASSMIGLPYSNTSTTRLGWHTKGKYLMKCCSDSTANCWRLIPMGMSLWCTVCSFSAKRCAWGGPQWVCWGYLKLSTTTEPSEKSSWNSCSVSTRNTKKTRPDRWKLRWDCLSFASTKTLRNASKKLLFSSAGFYDKILKIRLLFIILHVRSFCMDYTSLKKTAGRGKSW